MKDIQQLIKHSSQEGTYEKVFPKTFLDAVKDKKTGLSLTDILSGFNMYFLSYTGSIESTRLQVPSCLRRTGLWITYIKYDKTVVTEWYAGEDISDDAWKLNSNWRIGSSMLVGDITVSSEGNWIVNGTDTGVKATGEHGITPLLRIQDNKLQVSYTNGSSYTNINDTIIYTKFRENENKLQQSTDLGNTWTDISDYIAAWFRWKSEGPGGRDRIGKIQISRDGGNTWSDFSDDFYNGLYIKDYVSTMDELPSHALLGDIYGVGPTYASDDTEHTNPIYRLYVRTSSGWIDNGQFTSISAGITQEITDSEFTVPSNNAIKKQIDEQTNSIVKINMFTGLANGYKEVITEKYIKIGESIKGYRYSNDDCTNIVTQINYCYQDFTEIPAGVVSLYVNLIGGDSRLVFFDSNKQRISVDKAKYKELTKIDIPSNCKYFKMSTEYVFEPPLYERGVFYLANNIDVLKSENGTASDVEYSIQSGYITPGGKYENRAHDYYVATIACSNDCLSIDVNDINFNKGGSVINTLIINEFGNVINITDISNCTLHKGQTLYITSKISEPTFNINNVIIISKDSLKHSIEEELINIKSKISNTTEFSIKYSGKKKLESKEIIYGDRINSDGINTSQGKYIITSYDVSKYNGYTLKIYNICGSNAYGAFYNNGIIIDGTLKNDFSSSQTPYYVEKIVPDGATQLKISTDMGMSASPKVYIVLENESENIEEYLKLNNHKLDDKILLAIGDSTTAGSSPTTFKHWYDFTADNFNSLIPIGSGSSGATIAYHSDSTNSFMSRLENYLKYDNIDIYTIFGGINDFYYSTPTPLGTIDDNPTSSENATTLIGAMRFIFNKILEKNEDARIIVILPHTIKNPLINAINLSLEDYRQAIIKICKLYNIPYIDLSVLFGQTPFNGTGPDKYFSDTTHFNTEKGMKRVGDIIANYLKLIY